MSELPKSSGGKGGLSGGKGLGGSSAPTPLKRRDPDTFGPASFAEDSNANWHTASLAITASISESWFGESLVSTSVEDRIKQLGLPRSYLELPARFLGEKIPDAFAHVFGTHGEMQQLSESPLAQKVIASLSSRGVIALEHGLVQISRNMFINANDIDGSRGANESLDPGGSGSNTWMGPWGSGFGSRFLQNFRVFKDEDGVETGVWFTNAVFGTRAPGRDDTGELDAQEIFRREIMIPAFAKRLLYLAETPLPSSILDLGRHFAFKDLDESLWPTPFFSVNDFELTVCTIENPSGAPQTNFHIFPQVVNFGWTFTACEPRDLDVLLPLLVDATTVLMSIVEDGFRNYPTLENPYSWADIFGSLEDIPEGPAKAATSRWIPATQIGALVRMSNELNSRGHSESSAQDLAWVAQNGAGASAASVINSLVYSHLLPGGQLDDAREYLAVAVALDHLNESTNALANLGQVLLAAGDEDLAESTFLVALDRPDKYSEGEASLFLGDIYSKRKEAKKAKKFYERAAKSGHGVFALAARSRLEGESPTEQNPDDGRPEQESSNLPKFCVNCGTPFGSAPQKFCGGCGSPRQ
jgi:hypothetical protein